MDHLSPLLAPMTIALACVTWHARRLGNERRDVALLAAFTSASAVAGAAVTAL